MKKRYNPGEWDELRNKIIGLGENSSKRSYYPELQDKHIQLEKFKYLLDNFVEGLIVVNLTNGLVEEANQSAQSLLKGIKIGEKIVPILQNLKIENVGRLSSVAKAFSSGEMDDYIFNSNVDINGGNTILQFRLQSQEFGGVPYAVMRVSDITEKEKSNEAIKTSEANLQALIENTEDVIWSIDPQYRILSMNASFRETYLANFNYEVKLGDDILGHLPPDLINIWKERYNRVLKGEYFSIEREIEENAQLKYTVVSFSPIISDGIIKGAAIYLRDITERKKYEITIKENEEQLRKIIEGSPIGIVVSKNKLVDYANSTAISIFGYHDLSDVRNRCIAEFLAPKDRKSIDEMYHNGIAGSYLAERLEVTGINADGEELSLFASMTNIELFDGIATVISFDDISKQKEVEQTLIFAKTKAEESERLKSEFLAQMSHEIRTPINAILNFSSLISEDLKNVVSDDLKSGFEIINRAGKRIIRTIDLILNMSEVQAGTYEINFREINLYSEILIPIVKEYIPSALGKNINLSVGDDCRNIAILGDEYTITQIFANLIDNAIKYTDRGFVKIYSICDEHYGKHSVIIEDSGIGISKEYLPFLFDPFSQEEQGYTRKFEGNGLGLALVKKYCELNNAEIKVISVKNVGTKFIISL